MMATLYRDFNPIRRGEGVNRGSTHMFDRRLCFQAHDQYYECIENQNSDSPNKFLCLDQLYNYQTYCPVDFIYKRKQRYLNNQRDMKLWTQN